MTEVQTAQTIIKLPRYTKAGFDRLVQLTPDNMVLYENTLTEYALARLNSLNTWWRQAGVIRGELKRYKRALSAGKYMPDLEASQLPGEYEGALDTYNRSVWGIDLLLHMSKPNWDKLEEVSRVTDEWFKRNPDDRQIVAYCEVMRENSDLEMSPEEMRLRIARHGWSEIIGLVPYARLDEMESTVQDPLAEEKMELTEALTGKEWDEADLEQASQDYERHMKRMTREKYDLDLRKKITLFYEWISGNIPEDVSAIDILKAQDYIFEELKLHGAFDSE